MHTTTKIVSQQYFIVLFSLLTSTMIHSSQDGFTTSEESSSKTIDLDRHGLLDSPQETHKKHILNLVSKKVKSQQEFAQATTATEVRKIFEDSNIQTRSTGLTAIQYAIFADLPRIALLLLDDGDDIVKIDKDRLRVQLTMLNEKEFKNRSQNAKK